jgi:hypothetical protein
MKAMSLMSSECWRLLQQQPPSIELCGWRELLGAKADTIWHGSHELRDRKNGTAEFSVRML